MLDPNERREDKRDDDRPANDDYAVPEITGRDAGEPGDTAPRGSEGGVGLPDELTGRASGTADDLNALFGSDSPEHLADGFRGGSGDDPDDPDRDAGERLTRMPLEE